MLVTTCPPSLPQPPTTTPSSRSALHPIHIHTHCHSVFSLTPTHSQSAQVDPRQWRTQRSAPPLLHFHHRLHLRTFFWGCCYCISYAHMHTLSSHTHTLSTNTHTLSHTPAADPLKSVLDDGARDDLPLPTFTASSTTPSSGAAATASRLARSFRAQDVDNLLSVLGNGVLAPELRRSAAEQVCVCVCVKGGGPLLLLLAWRAASVRK